MYLDQCLDFPWSKPLIVLFKCHKYERWIFLLICHAYDQYKASWIDFSPRDILFFPTNYLRKNVLSIHFLCNDAIRWWSKVASAWYCLWLHSYSALRCVSYLGSWTREYLLNCNSENESLGLQSLVLWKSIDFVYF